MALFRELLTKWNLEKKKKKKILRNNQETEIVENSLTRYLNLIK